MDLKDYDNKMITHYQNTYNLLKNKNNEIIKLKTAIKILEDDPQYNDLCFIFQDINFMFETFEMMSIACKNRQGVKQNFFNLTTFNRVFISTIIIIFSKLKKMLKKDENFSEDIKEYLYEIGMFIEKSKLIRNKIEHDIDPYYSGKIEEVQNELNLTKYVEFINMVLKLITMLPITQMKIKMEDYKIDYTSISLEERKKIISNTKINFLKIFEYITELSYRPIDNMRTIKNWIEINVDKSNHETNEYIKKTVTSEEEKNMIDLCMKTIELNNAILFTYRNKDSTKSSIGDKDTYIYFCRICLTISYQIFDKIGLYLKNKFSLELDKSYFKMAIDEIIKKSLVIDETTKKICDTRNSSEYLALSKFRKFTEHENGTINYKNYVDEISSLIIANYKNIVELIEKIVNEYFIQNHIMISDIIRREADEKSLLQRL